MKSAEEFLALVKRYESAEDSEGRNRASRQTWIWVYEHKALLGAALDLAEAVEAEKRAACALAGAQRLRGAWSNEAEEKAFGDAHLATELALSAFRAASSSAPTARGEGE